jgi:hypothetical protein
VWPNRSLLTLVVLVLGVLVGAAVALVPQFVRPTFDSTRSLAELTGLQVLGAVSILPKPGDPLILRQEVRRLSFAGGALAFVAVALLVVGDAGARAIQSLLA